MVDFLIGILLLFLVALFLVGALLVCVVLPAQWLYKRLTPPVESAVRKVAGRYRLERLGSGNLGAHAGQHQGVQLRLTPIKPALSITTTDDELDIRIDAQVEIQPLHATEITRSSRARRARSRRQDVARHLEGGDAEHAKLLRAMLADPALCSALGRFVAHAYAGKISGAGVRYTVSGMMTKPRRLRSATDDALRLVKALDRFYWGPWHRLAGQYGLELTRGEVARVGLAERLSQVGRASIWARLEGDIEGQAVQIDARSREPSRIRLALPSGLPADLTVRDRKGQTGGVSGGISTANPIIDAQLFVAGSDPAAIRALLSHDELTGSLLELIKGQPGSEIRQGVLVYTWPDRLLVDLEDRLDAVLELSETLVRCWQEVQAETQATEPPTT